MTEASERPKHDPDDIRGGGGTGGGPGPEAQELWQKISDRERAEKEGTAQPEVSSEPPPGGEE